MTAGEPSTDLKIKAHCNTCAGQTNHLILHKHRADWSDGDEQHSVSGADTYSLIRCAGCDSIHLLHENWFSENWDENGPIVNSVYYPPAISRRKPDWLSDPNGPFFWGDTEIEKLLKEIYSALQNNSRRLAAMGNPGAPRIGND